MPLSKNENLISDNSPSVPKALFLASRPKTWIASVSPVLIGTALSPFHSWSLLFFTLAFSLLIQIGTNYANDYYDFFHGADAKRIGPARAVASGWISPFTMYRAMWGAFAAAFCASLPLVAASGLWALLFVASSIAFGILYTGGPKPLGYMGLGELLVFIYFGPVAVLGASFVQTQWIDPDIFWISFSPGLLSCAILVANNLRDQKTDQIVKKNTLVVRFGKTFGSWEYALCVSGALIIPLFFGLYGPLLLVPLVLFLIRKAFGEDLVSLLPQTALLLIIFTGAICL